MYEGINCFVLLIIIILEANSARKFESCCIKDLRSMQTLQNLWLYCFKTSSQRNEHTVIPGKSCHFRKLLY